MPRKWHPTNRDDFVTDYLSEKSFGDLACKYGINEDLLARYGREIGLVRPPRTRNLKRRVIVDDAAVVAAYEGGMSELAVSKAFSIERSSVRLRLKEAGVHIRNKSEAETLKWSRMTEAERITQVSAAHIAATGVPNTLDQKLKTAATVQAKGLRTHPLETTFSAMLAMRGIAAIPQQAIGPYNCDLGSFPVAVEIFGGGFHFFGKHLARKPERFRYILDAGWHVICVWVTQHFPMCEAGADYVAAFIEQARRDPSAIREYRVIRGAGEVVAAGRADDDEFSFKPALAVRRNSLSRNKTVPG